MTGEEVALRLYDLYHNTQRNFRNPSQFLLNQADYDSLREYMEQFSVPKYQDDPDKQDRYLGLPILICLTEKPILLSTAVVFDKLPPKPTPQYYRAYTPFLEDGSKSIGFHEFHHILTVIDNLIVCDLWIDDLHHDGWSQPIMLTNFVGQPILEAYPTAEKIEIQEGRNYI